ncbi:glycosyltransferase family 2 protein [Pseudomonas sp. GD03842]|uniref:glycosyltransferase family 2 protein n=1 Tax=Pseudomonas sp. GD03842 TaxID=2975385 RepID=UPI002446D8CE|nr:glycosyltransferase family 2 protein [Pseudomonas sp. GD03842]MDH0748956.1 glycosyltransferase family 2 protein [Pseudomonas sp. GD03842]
MATQVNDRRSGPPYFRSDDGRESVAILMCTYNGASFLKEQLDSFEAQGFSNWTLYVSDDGSSDTTKAILTEYADRWGPHKLIIFDGPKKGFAQNFLSLIRRPDLTADYFAFSDQDDIWFGDKLGRGMAALARVEVDIPSMYCTRTRLIDEEGQVIGHSPDFEKPPSFQNALVQSIAGANTMLINSAARQILARVPVDAYVVAHDWLAYLLISGCGGQIHYDALPTLDYRQHGNNLIGSNSKWGDKLKRLVDMFSGQRKAWTDANLHILESIDAPLTEENRTIIAHFKRGRALGLPARLWEIKKSGVYRQTRSGSVSLYVAACLGKV